MTPLNQIITIDNDKLSVLKEIKILKLLADTELKFM